MFQKVAEKIKMADAEELVFDYYEDIWNVTFYERDVTKGLVRFVSPLLLLLGTVGNIFNVFITEQFAMMEVRYKTVFWVTANINNFASVQ